jgi:hypothetical protein
LKYIHEYEAVNENLPPFFFVHRPQADEAKAEAQAI